MHTFYLINVYLHILAATMWLGGMLFFIGVIIPAIRKNPDKAELLHTVGIRFRTAGWVALIVLLLTGLGNMYFRGISFTANDLCYTFQGKLIATKLLLFSLILVVSGVHDFYIGTKATELMKDPTQTEKAARFRRMARLIGRLNFLIALVMAGIGVIIVRGW